MSAVTVPASGAATSVYPVDSAITGSHSRVNVNVNFSNAGTVICDKIELIGVGGGGGAGDTTPPVVTASTLSVTGTLDDPTVGSVTVTGIGSVPVAGGSFSAVVPGLRHHELFDHRHRRGRKRLRANDLGRPVERLMPCDFGGAMGSTFNGKAGSRQPGNAGAVSLEFRRFTCALATAESAENGL